MEPRGNKKVFDSLILAYPQYLKSAKDIEMPTQLYQLSDVAWKTAVDAGIISNLDYDLAYQLNQVYGFQEKINSVDEAIMENLKDISGRKETFETLQKTILMSQKLAVNLQDSAFFQPVIYAIDSTIDH